MKQTGSHGKESIRNNRGRVGNGVVYAVLDKGLHNEDTSRASQLSAASQAVKRRLGGRCDLAASLGVRQLEH